MFTWGDDVTVTGRGDLLQLGDIVTSYYCRNDVGLGSGVTTQCRMEICLRLCGITEVTPLGIHKSHRTENQKFK